MGNGPVYLEYVDEPKEGFLSAELSPDETQIVTTDLDNNIEIWDLHGHLIHTICDILGLYIWNLDLSKLHPQSKISNSLMGILGDYGAILSNSSKFAQVAKQTDNKTIPTR